MGTALIYDEEMCNYKLLWVDPACKIEVPERLTASHEALWRRGLAPRCVSVPVREATDADVLLVHSKEYLEAVKKTPFMSLEELKEFTLQFGDVYFHPNIYACARLAAGAALQLVDAVLTGKVRNGMALVRPPGHHSMRDAASGFCIFNNVAIAAKYAQQKYGLQRVLIVDWDIHHGQGVQYCFEDDPSVLYFSWHRYEHQKFWPQLRESDYDSVGKEGGAGFNINVPWNQVGMRNSDYLAIFCHVLLPVAYEFCPDLVLVCAGFDSAVGDPEGEMSATPDVFAHLTHLLMNLAGGKVCAVLEGGYNLRSLAESVCETVQTLLGDPAPRPAQLSAPCGSALESLHCVRAAHRKFWSCLKHAADTPTSELGTKRVKVAAEEVDVQEGEAKEEVAWPEVPARVAPTVRTAALLPAAVVCPDGCSRFNSLHSDALRGKLSDTVAASSVALSSVAALVDEMQKNEIGSGLALVSDVSIVANCIIQHAAASTSNRLLVVCVGDCGLDVTHSGQTLVVHFIRRLQGVPSNKYYIPVCLKEGCSDTAAVLQAVLGLLLPLGLQYDPDLVVLARAVGSGLCDSMWLQLIGLLGGLAQGHTLVLLQENEASCVRATASCLSGEAAPSLGQLPAAPSEDVEALEMLRRQLQDDWRFLRTEASHTQIHTACPTLQEATHPGGSASHEERRRSSDGTTASSNTND